MAFDTELWRRIKAVEFDQPGADLTWSARLARDNGWTAGYAKRVVEEYRRFAFLAMTAGFEVTPSDEVDQAWHLHLTYTRHYWGPFTQALGRPLHHNPTDGGAMDAKRFRENYRKTLTEYRTAFGGEPPPDIWPDEKIRFTAPLRMRRVDISSMNIGRRRRSAAIGAAIVAIAGASLAVAAAQGSEPPALDELSREQVIGGMFLAALGLVALARIFSRRGGGKKGDGSGGGCGGDSGCGGCGD